MSGVKRANGNIGPIGCKRRGRMAWVWLALGAGLVAALAMRDAPMWSYSVAAGPFFLAALNHFQAREQTCVFLAVVGRQDLDGGSERITDAGVLSRMRSEANRVWGLAIVATAGLMALTFVAAAIAG